MLSRSFGASTFTAFWQYWNPIWGYGLGKYVYAPLQKILPSWTALLITFVVSGALHDIVVMALRQSIAFTITIWFLFLGIGVVASEALGVEFSKQPKMIRVAINLTYLLTCFILMLVTKNTFKLP
jgi:hypothetical protein